MVGLTSTARPASATTSKSAAPKVTVTPKVSRLAGLDRIGTAVDVSHTSFAAGSAKAVVLARDDMFPDALAAGPMAAAKDGPLLLSAPDSLPTATADEISRVLPQGGTVYLIGGDQALSPAVATTVAGLGYNTVRIAGADRYATAVAVAQALGNPSMIFEATGADFADALAGVPAAIKDHGAILLTDGYSQSPATAAYLAAHPGDTRYALGGPAAKADPTATPVFGQDRYGTAAKIAATFFPSASVAAVATGQLFPDAVSGGPMIGRSGGPMLLIDPTGPLPQPEAAYLNARQATLTSLDVLGGPDAVPDGTVTELRRALEQTSPLLRPPSTGVVVGAYVQEGAYTNDSAQPAMRYLEAEVGRNLVINQHYYAWTDTFTQGYIPADHAAGQVPLLSWRTTSVSDAQVLDGSQDGLIRQHAETLKAYGFPIFLRFDSEMNSAGGGHVWAGNPQQYVAMWRYVQHIFDEVGATNVVWVWTPNSNSNPDTPANAIQAYYPGNAYVDWVGIDGFNFGTEFGDTWDSLGSVMSQVYSLYSGVKPIMIAETGSAPSNAYGSESQWITQAGTWIESHPDIKALVYFDVKAEGDFAIDRTPQVEAAFKAMVDQPYFRATLG